MARQKKTTITHARRIENMGNRKKEINFPIFKNWGVRFDEIVFLLW